jgi:hypothetical protein
VSTLDGTSLFSSGPHAFRCGSWERCLQRRSFPGVDGELLIDGGLRSRTITQTGRLQADAAAGVASQIAAIEAMIDGAPHTLVDNHGRRFNRVVMEHFELATPLTRGRGCWCDYTIRYRQLP